MKKILRFIVILIPWLIGGFLFRSDKVFYKSLNKPIFAPPSYIFPIAWTILYILISINILKTFENQSIKDYPEYSKALLINYISNQLFSFLFFNIKSPFLALIDTFIVLMSSLFLYNESKSINEKDSKLLIPYIIWNLFATILIIFIFFMNL